MAMRIRCRSVVLLSLLLLCSGTALAFKASIHPTITKLALALVSRTINSKVLKFTNQAIVEVAQANYDTDCGGDANCACIECQQDASRHFDSERFISSSNRLLTLKEAIIANITSGTPNGAAARTALGQAVHGVQDFYAHSTWVEVQGSGSIFAKLGREQFTEGDPGFAFFDSDTCAGSDHATLESLGLSRVTTGYFAVPD